jgi:hypothetical protein
MFKKECKFEECLDELAVDLMKYLCKFRTTIKSPPEKRAAILALKKILEPVLIVIKT